MMKKKQRHKCNFIEILLTTIKYNIIITNKAVTKVASSSKE